MMHVGEDRGARIHIEGSTFKHSKFCMGMISYREIQDISYQEEKTLMKLRDLVTREEDYALNDNRTESFIRIKNSVFQNLAFHQPLNVLSNLKHNTTSCGYDKTTLFFNCVFKEYDHRGFVINTEGFPGGIQIQDSTFYQNMAYIKDYLIRENSQTNDEYYAPESIKFSIFEQQTG